MDPTTIWTRQNVETVVDTVLCLDKSPQQQLLNGFILRRASNESAWKRILKYSDQTEDNENILDDETTLEQFQLDMTPWFFGLEVLNEQNQMCGFVTFYMVYSSWNGKILHLDQIQCSDFNEQVEKRILQILANVAVATGCARLTWTHKETPDWHKEGSNRPEMHEELLTLCMTKESMEQYAKSTFGETEIIDHQQSFSKTHVDMSIEEVLQMVNAKDNKFKLRLAKKGDVDIISKQVHGLAVYVKEEDAVMLDGTDYKRDGFLENPLFTCLIVETTAENGTSVPCGFAFFFFGYQLGKGRFMHLEDLFIEEKYRQGGGGSLVMATLAQIGISLNLSNFYWQALDWNTGALSFYRKIGAQIIDGLKTSRYTTLPSGALQEFAEK